MKNVIFLGAAAALLIVLATPSWAVTDFKIYGSARLDTGYRFTDRADTAPPGGKNTLYNFFLDNPGNSRLGFRATAGDVTGVFELNLSSSSSAIGAPSVVTPSVGVRHMYAEWNMGGGSSLLFGQTWSQPAFGFDSMPERLNRDRDLEGFGALYLARNPQVRYTYASEKVTLKVAVEQTKATTIKGLNNQATNYLATDYLPEVWARATFKPFNVLRLEPGFVWQQNRLVGEASGISDVTVNAYAFALDGRLSLDFAQLDFEGWWGSNVADFAQAFDPRPSATTKFGAPVANASGTDVRDVASWGGAMNVLVPLSVAKRGSASHFELNVGGGYQQAGVENEPSANYESSVSIYSIYVNVLYNLTDAFYIQPEVSWFNYGNDANKNAFGPGKNDLGSDLFAGVHLQVDF